MAAENDHITVDASTDNGDSLSSPLAQALTRFGPSLFRPVLLGITGPMRGSRIALTKPRLVIGRSSSADVTLTDPGASRAHAVITYENFDKFGELPLCTIEDLNSRNGTELNGRMVTTKTALKERDRILIGRSVLGYFLRDDAEIRHDETLYESATRDALTGLDNRRQLIALMRSHLARVQRAQSPLTFLLLDVDHFKSINDTYGHDVGDQVLRQIAMTLKGSVRESDLVGRWGGEEFAIGLPDTNVKDGLILAERVRTKVAAQELVLGSRAIRVTVSLGGAEVNLGDTMETLFKRADERLYEAKAKGRNQVRLIGADLRVLVAPGAGS